LTCRALPRIASPVTDFSLVIFDYDGTLFDTRLAIVHCMHRALVQRGRATPSRSAVEEAVGTGATLPDTLLLLDPRLRHDHATLEELVVSYRAFYRDEGATQLRPYPGVGETLQHLHLGGITCAVVSNKGIEAIRRSLDATGLSTTIDFVVGDQPGTPKKPDPSVVTSLIAPRYGLRREEMLIVGDTELDIEFAKQTGIASCWASYGYGKAASCRALEPDYEISSIGQLREIVAKGDPRRAYQATL
jgi:phosphoglycolate phosphatase